MLLFQLIVVELLVIKLGCIVMLRMSWLTSGFSVLRILYFNEVSLQNSQQSTIIDTTHHFPARKGHPQQRGLHEIC
jgi:hypothetical protein